MKSRTGAGLGFIVLALCLVLLLVLVQGLANTPFHSAARPMQSPIQPTALPTVDIVATEQSAAATLAVQATATTAALPPMATPGAIAGPNVIIDESNRARLSLPEGWYAMIPSGEGRGVIAIANYDFFNFETRPDFGLMIDIGFGPLPVGTTFETWVTERQAEATTPERGGYATSTTELQPYSLGRYNGFTFTTNDAYGPSSQAIYLLTGDNQIIAINIRPAKTSEETLSRALEILATLEVSPLQMTTPSSP